MENFQSRQENVSVLIDSYLDLNNDDRSLFLKLLVIKLEGKEIDLLVQIVKLRGDVKDEAKNRDDDLPMDGYFAYETIDNYMEKDIKDNLDFPKDIMKDLKEIKEEMGGLCGNDGLVKVEMKKPSHNTKLIEVYDEDTKCTNIYREKSKKLIGYKFKFNKEDELEEAINGLESNEKKKKAKKCVKTKMIQQVTCTECGDVSKNNTQLLKHHRLFHKASKINPGEKRTCPTCGKSVVLRYFEYHVAKHDPQADLTRFERYECDKCGKKFVYEYLKNQHLCERDSSCFTDNDSRIICTLCLHVFNDLKEVLSHKEKNHMKAFEMNLNNKGNVSIFKCPIMDCLQMFKNISEVKKHLQSYHFSVKQVNCTNCDEKFRNSQSMKTHRQHVHGLGADLECGNCHEKFFSQAKLDHHIYLKHTDERRHLCTLCPKAFKKTDGLKRHMLCHDINNSKFQCEQCGKKFRDKVTLGYHINTHTGEKPFKCQYCSYAAASYPVLHLHKIKCPYVTNQNVSSDYTYR